MEKKTSVIRKIWTAILSVLLMIKTKLMLLWEKLEPVRKKLEPVAWFILLIVFLIATLSLIGLSKVKVDDFHKAAVMFVVDASASNQKQLPALS